MTIERAALFRDALRSIKVMHDHNWIHRDIKPANIGVVGEPPKAVLLDTGTAIQIKDNEKINPAPGFLGTIGFIAPECELQPYDYGVDVWAMGIIGYMMMYNRHPWKLRLNPWRSDPAHRFLRPLFYQSYAVAIQQLADDYARCRNNPSDGYIHRKCTRVTRNAISLLTVCDAVGQLILDMLRHPWSDDNPGERVTIDEALNHDDWGLDFLLYNRGTKRARK